MDAPQTLCEMSVEGRFADVRNSHVPIEYVTGVEFQAKRAQMAHIMDATAFIMRDAAGKSPLREATADEKQTPQCEMAVVCNCSPAYYGGGSPLAGGGRYAPGGDGVFMLCQLAYLMRNNRDLYLDYMEDALLVPRDVLAPMAEFFVVQPSVERRVRSVTKLGRQRGFVENDVALLGGVSVEYNDAFYNALARAVLDTKRWLRAHQVIDPENMADATRRRFELRSREGNPALKGTGMRAKHMAIIEIADSIVATMNMPLDDHRLLQIAAQTMFPRGQSYVVNQLVTASPGRDSYVRTSCIYTQHAHPEDAAVSAAGGSATRLRGWMYSIPQIRSGEVHMRPVRVLAEGTSTPVSDPALPADWASFNVSVRMGITDAPSPPGATSVNVQNVLAELDRARK